MFRQIREALKPAYEWATSFEVDISSVYTEVPGGNRAIPNIVYQTWKRPILPFRHARGVSRFRRMNMDYSFRFFDDEGMAEYMNRAYAGHPILEIFNDALIPASKADIWRYCILFKEGGIYCDIDSALAVPLREIMGDNPSELISFENGKWQDRLGIGNFADPAVFLPCPSDRVRQRLDCPDHVVLNWMLCFAKGSGILAEVINLIVRHAVFFRGKSFDGPMVPILHFTGPLALTQAVWRFVQKTDRRPHQCGIDFNGSGVFKLPGERQRYAKSPHYSTIPAGMILSPRDFSR